MTLRVVAMKEQLAGLQAACDQYNTAAKAADPDPLPDMSVHVDLTAEAYWDKVYADVKDKDPRSEQDIFNAACESYQSNFNVGLGTEAISKLHLTKAEVDQAEAANQNAEELKARYQAELDSATAASAALVKGVK